jgi:hypothetical protein
MKLAIILSFSFFSFSLFAQDGAITVEQDERISDLVSKQISINKESPKIDGFRVQIHFSQNQNRIESEKKRAQFSSDFPNIKTYLEFKEPYFKIQAGDFVNKVDAYEVLKEIRSKYVGAYIVPAEVYFDELIKKRVVK